MTVLRSFVNMDPDYFLLPMESAWSSKSVSCTGDFHHHQQQQQQLPHQQNSQQLYKKVFEDLTRPVFRSWAHAQYLDYDLNTGQKVRI